MSKQSALPLIRLDQAMKKKVTKREIFLAEMDAAVPRSLPLSIIEPHFPKLGPHRGRPPISRDDAPRPFSAELAGTSIYPDFGLAKKRNSQCHKEIVKYIFRKFEVFRGSLA